VISDEEIGESSSVRPSKRLRDSTRVERATASPITGEASECKDGLELDGLIRVTPSEHRKLRAAFRREAKLSRSNFKGQLVSAWEREFPSMGDKENMMTSPEPGAENPFDNDDCAYDHFASARMDSHDQWAAEKKATFLASLQPVSSPFLEQTEHAIKLPQERVQALWEGLRRRYFGEVEHDPDSEDGHLSDSSGSLHDDNVALRLEIARLRDDLRRNRRTRRPAESSPPVSFGPHDNDSDDHSPGGTRRKIHQLPKAMIL
jgi:hypothetical protein